MSTILRIWSDGESRLSSDPDCLAALLYLQLAIPGQFKVLKCVRQDILPALTHDGRISHGLSAIFHRLSSEEFNSNIDKSLNALQSSTSVAWRVYVQSNVADLTNYMKYSHPQNWAKHTCPTLAATYPLPQRYFVPQRIREIYRPRLEAVHLWNIQPDDKVLEDRMSFGEKSKKKKTDLKLESVHAFNKEKVLEKARSVYELCDRLLGSRAFFFSERPGKLDVCLAAQLLPMLAPFPDSLLADLLAESYPRLLEHAKRVRDAAFPEDMIVEFEQEPWSAWTLLPTW